MTQRTTETQHRETATRNRETADVQELFCRVLHHTTAEHKPGLQNNGAGAADPPTKGQPGDPVTPPIVLSGVFFLPGDPTGPYQYARWSNPTWTALEEALSILEDAETVIFPSGMATVAAVLSSQLKPGDRILLPSDAYYTSRVLADKYLATAGVRVATCPSADYDKQDFTGFRMIFIETPSNPGLDVCDIRKPWQRPSKPAPCSSPTTLCRRRWVSAHSIWEWMLSCPRIPKRSTATPTCFLVTSRRANPI